MMKFKWNLKYSTVFLIAFCLAIIFISLDTDAHNLDLGDTAIYARIAKNLAAGNGFSQDATAPFLPTMSREPLYPLFLGIIFSLFGGSIFAVQVIQALIYALTCILIFKIICYTGLDNKSSFRVALAIAVFPTLANYCACLLTEILFAFLLALLLLSLCKAIKSRLPGWYFFAGAILGIASLCKAVLLPYGIFMIFFIVRDCLKKARQNFISKAIRYSLFFLSGLILVITPWITRNYFIFGKPGIALRGYDALYVRATKVNLNNNELKMYAVYSVSEYLANKLYPGYNLVSRCSGYFYGPLLQKHTAYLRQGRSAQELDSAFKKEAISLIKAHPVRFLTTGIFEIIKLNSFSQLPLLNSESANKFLAGSLFLSLARGMLKLFGYLLFAFAIVGMIITYRLQDKWMVIFSVVLYFNLIYFFFDAIGRYATPIIPYYIFFASLVFMPKFKLNADNPERCAG